MSDRTNPGEPWKMTSENELSVETYFQANGIGPRDIFTIPDCVEAAVRLGFPGNGRRHYRTRPTVPNPSGERIFCRFSGCPRGGPIYDPATSELQWNGYDGKAGLGSHRRRQHGIASIGYRERRPSGGKIRCTYVDPHTHKPCSVEPYQTKGGLGAHLLQAHGQHSQEPDTVARRQRRAKARGESLVPIIVCTFAEPHTHEPCAAEPYEERKRCRGTRVLQAYGQRQPPDKGRGESRVPIVVALTEPARLLPGARNHLRLMLRNLIGFQWPTMFHTSAEVLRDTVAELCATNLEDPRDDRQRIDPQMGYAAGETAKRGRRAQTIWG